MKVFRFFLDIDAENLEEAKEKLIDMAGDGGSFGDLDNVEIEDTSDKLTYDQLMTILGVKDRDKNDALSCMDGKHFTTWDGWWCVHCGETVGCDTGDMIYHLMKHTAEELKVTQDGDPIEEEEE